MSLGDTYQFFLTMFGIGGLVGLTWALLTTFARF